MAARKQPEPPVTEVTGLVCFRYSSYDTPLWARPNSLPARWHSEGDEATQYLSAHPAAAWAELARAERLRTEDDLALARTGIWAMRVTQAGIVDYSDFALAEQAGFPPEALIDDDHTRCRVEGRRLRDLHYRGVLAPSAALPETLSLTLFGPRVVSGWGREPALASTVPAALVAVGGPPPGLAADVRHVGAPHRGWAEYGRRR
jgi:RES domain-containing protein